MAETRGMGLVEALGEMERSERRIRQLREVERTARQNGDFGAATDAIQERCSEQEIYEAAVHCVTGGGRFSLSNLRGTSWAT